MKEKVLRQISLLKELYELGKQFLTKVNTYYPGHGAEICARLIIMDNYIAGLNVFADKAEKVDWDNIEEAQSFKRLIKDYVQSTDPEFLFSSLDCILDTNNNLPPEGLINETSEMIGKMHEKAMKLELSKYYEE